MTTSVFSALKREVCVYHNACCISEKFHDTVTICKIKKNIPNKNKTVNYYEETWINELCKVVVAQTNRHLEKEGDYSFTYYKK